MNIVFNCDNNYSSYLAVVITSICKFRKNSITPINFYVLSNNINIENITYLRQIAVKYECNIQFIPIQEDEFKDFPITINYISKASYARLKIADYLPELNKVIYLDIDILVLQDLNSLWESELEGFPIGACYDSFIENTEYKTQIGLNKSHYYFNSGILLINLDLWRKYNVFNKSLEIIKNNEHIKYQDQDILNIIFEHNVKYLNTKYNFTVNHRKRIKNKNTLLDVEVCQMPIIIFHYVGGKKPWHKKCTTSKSSLFYKIYQSLENKPNSWSIEIPSFLTRLNRKRKDIADKYLYRIY